MARGQSALDGFAPNPNGEVHIVVVQPDGRILLGGRFTNILGVARNRIARLNHDGSLDMSFDPNANDMVFGLALQADGKILVGGLFEGTNSIGGQTRDHIARLDPVTGLADAFDPNASNDVASIAVQADGRILAVGAFDGIGGQTRHRIARLDPVTGLADSFDPNANQNVYSVAVQADGKILAGGAFSGANCIGGQTRNFFARLDPVTGQADSFNVNASNAVLAIALQADGKILAGGSFTNIGGQARNRIARLDASTGLADAFNPNANGVVFSLGLQPDGKVLAGGVFDNIGGQARGRVARLDPATGLADSFNPNAPAGANVDSFAVQSDGKVLIGGAFTNLAPNGGPGLSVSNIARLEADGRLDRTLIAPVTGAYVSSIAIQLDHEILVGGGFSVVNGITRSCIARLNTDGTLDTGFNPDANNVVYTIATQPDGKVFLGGAFNMIGSSFRYGMARVVTNTGMMDFSFVTSVNAPVLAMAMQGDGKILVGGTFTNVNGLARNHIARLASTNGVVDSFDPNANGDVYSIAVQPDGRILAGGDFNGFTSIGGQSRNGIARLDPTTALAESFDPNANNTVTAVAVQADGKIIVGGTFTSIQGMERNRIARLNPDGSLDLAFNPNANGVVYSIALQADGKIVVGGFFNGTNSIGGQSRNRIARLDPVTGQADSFNPNVSHVVYAIGMQADGKILAGGEFFTVGGIGRSRLARLSNDIAAQQHLAMTPSTVTWTRGGSSPQLVRAVFEISTNNLSYTLLGNGTASGSNWTLTGLILPAGQNLYVRARGYYPSGIYNGSECTTESVRNAFLPSQPLLNIQRSGNTNVVLSWWTNFTGFTLEASTNLNSSTWSIVTPPPSVSGTNHVVTNPVSGSARYYRLRQ